MPAPWGLQSRERVFAALGSGEQQSEQQEGQSVPSTPNWETEEPAVFLGWAPGEACALPIQTLAPTQTVSWMWPQTRLLPHLQKSNMSRTMSLTPTIYQWLPLLRYRLHKQNNLECLEFYVIVILMEPKEMTLWRENTCFIWVLVEANRECVFYYTGYWKSSLSIQTHQYHKECFNWESNNSFGARNFINWSYLIILILDQSHPIETSFDSNLINRQKSANYKYDSGDDYHCGVHRQVFICT